MQSTRRLTLLLFLLVALCSILFVATANAADTTNASKPSSLSGPITSIDTLLQDQRTTFSEENRPTRPVFNSVIDSPEIGDERQFILIYNLDEPNLHIPKLWKEQTFQPFAAMTPQALVAGHTYRVAIYYRNDGQLDEENDPVIYGAKLAIQMPEQLDSQDTTAAIVATLSASNTKPQQVTSAVRISSETHLELQLVKDSIQIHNGGQINGDTLSDALFADGVEFGYNYQNGALPGNSSGYITYDFIAYDPSGTIVPDDSTTPDATTSLKDSNPANSGSALELTEDFTVHDMLILSVIALMVSMLFGVCIMRLTSKAQRWQDQPSSEVPALDNEVIFDSDPAVSDLPAQPATSDDTLVFHPAPDAPRSASDIDDTRAFTL